MLTLYLLRHAKSSWGKPGLRDHERPLNKRGEAAAPLMGQHMAAHRLRPDLVLCSDAKRTQATLKLVLEALGEPAPDVIYDNALYLAPPAEIFQFVRDHAAGHTEVMVVGHNPGMHALALGLSGDGDASGLSQLASKFPTAALAVLRFDCDGWDKVRPESGRLDAFVTPRGLA